jgi:hypothetical protein
VDAALVSSHNPQGLSVEEGAGAVTEVHEHALHRGDLLLAIEGAGERFGPSRADLHFLIPLGRLGGSGDGSGKKNGCDLERVRAHECGITSRVRVGFTGMARKAASQKGRWRVAVLWAGPTTSVFKRV